MLEGEFMLVKDETRYCWVLGEHVGTPLDSIKDAIEDFIKTYNEAYETVDSDHSYMCKYNVPYKQVNIGHPYRYVPEVDGERVIWDVCDYDLDDEIAEWSDDYMKDVKNEHINELSKELTKVFQAWEKRHGYVNTAFVIFETKTYQFKDYIEE